jgi:hypothetical protein
MRLRLGLLVADLAARFCVSKTTCSDIIARWTDYLDRQFKCLISWPSRSVIDETMPQGFKDMYPNCRVVIDCTEIFTETPQSLVSRSLMYSQYKSHMTWKSLVGITPNGVISFVSDLWAGSISDKQITEKSGLLDLCEPGDSIMTDKGFLISDLTTVRGIYLTIPPKKRDRKQLSRRDVEKTRRIANLRMHVERHMERVKNFRILQGVMPITMSKNVTKIWRLCNALTSLQPPLCPD